MNPRTRPVVIFFSLILLVVALAATSVYFYKKANTASVDPTVQETQSLIAEVSKIILLPENEVPTIATVSEPEKLQNQEFFKDAKKGDKVLIYTDARKAILYDPVAKKIVNVAPISIGANAPGTVTEPSAQQ